jgi:hypothetical protein
MLQKQFNKLITYSSAIAPKPTIYTNKKNIVSLYLNKLSKQPSPIGGDKIT